MMMKPTRAQKVERLAQIRAEHLQRAKDWISKAIAAKDKP